MNNFGKNIFLWVVIGLLLVALFNLFQGSTNRAPQTQMAYSDFLGHVNQNEVKRVTIQGQNISGELADGRSFSTYAPNDPTLVKDLTGHNVRVSAVPPDDNVPSLFGVLVSWFPFLVLIGVWIFFMRQMQSGGGRAMGFGKSRARLLTEKTGRVTFDDVAGINLGQQLRVADLVRPPCLRRVLKHIEQRDQQQADDDPDREVPEMRVHLHPFLVAPDRARQRSGPHEPHGLGKARSTSAGLKIGRTTMFAKNWCTNRTLRF